MTKPRECGALSLWHANDQKNEAIKTEKMLIHAQTINAVTTTMGNP
jgi:hypothetical protein